MLDLKLIRDQPDEVARRLATRGADAGRLIQDLLARDGERRRLLR
jgi:seryl-tRNA synthetase